MDKIDPALTSAIAAALGFDWQRVIPPDDGNAHDERIQGPDALIGFRLDWRTLNHLTVYGLLPDRPNYSTSAEIRVSRKKTPAAIAADIRRRFLPEYHRWREKKTAELAEDERIARERAEIFQAINAITPCKFRAGQMEEYLDLRQWQSEISARVRVTSATSIMLRVDDLPEGAVLAMLCTLRAYLEREGQSA